MAFGIARKLIGLGLLVVVARVTTATSTQELAGNPEPLLNRPDQTGVDVRSGLEARTRILAGGGRESKRCRLFEAEVGLPADQTLHTIQLPADDRVKLLGVTLVRADDSVTVTISLAGHYTDDGLGEYGEADPGDFDGGKIAFPVEPIRRRLSGGAGRLFRSLRGIPFELPPLGILRKNVVSCRAQCLSVPPGHYTTAYLLVGSVRGDSVAPFAYQFEQPGRPATSSVKQIPIPDWCHRDTATGSSSTTSSLTQ